MTKHQSLIIDSPGVSNSPEPNLNLKPQFSTYSQPASLEEAEFKERHGGQYHLRHHLSGCSQTLYSIDFQNDFSNVEQVEQRLATLLDHQELASAASTEWRYTAATLLEPAPITVMPTLLSPVIAETSSQPTLTSEDNVEPTTTFNSAHNTVVTPPLPAQFPSQEISTAESLEEMPTPQPERYLADFNDDSLGGWTVDGSLDANQVLGDGQLHFTRDELNVNQPLLQQQFSFASEGRYQFEMLVNTTAGNPLPDFVLTVNNTTIPLIVEQHAEGYILRADFNAPASEPVNIAIIPTSPLPPDGAIWLDNLIVQPAPPSIHLGLILETAIGSDFAFTEQAESRESISLDAVLIPSENSVMPHNQFLAQENNTSFTLKEVIGDVALNEWNMRPTTAEQSVPATVESGFVDSQEEMKTLDWLAGNSVG